MLLLVTGQQNDQSFGVYRNFQSQKCKTKLKSSILNKKAALKLFSLKSTQKLQTRWSTSQKVQKVLHLHNDQNWLLKKVAQRVALSAPSVLMALDPADHSSIIFEVSRLMMIQNKTVICPAHYFVVAFIIIFLLILARISIVKLLRAKVPTKRPYSYFSITIR